MKGAWDIIIRLRPTIFVAVLAFVLLSQPSQILELYLIDIETTQAALADGVDSSSSRHSVLQIFWEMRHILLAMAAGVLAIAVLWLSSAHLVCLDQAAKNLTKWHAVLAKTLVALITLAPIYGVLSGLNSIRTGIVPIAGDSSPVFEASILNYMLISFAFLVSAAAAVAMTTAKWLDAGLSLARRLFSRMGVVLGLGLILSLTVAITIWPAALPSALGTLGIVYVFLAALAFVLTWFANVFRQTGWPVTIIVLTAAMTFSLADLNDNHWVDYTLKKDASPGLEESFTQWFAERKDRQHFSGKGKPYPVYVVAAEGGGMYAGYHVSSFLGRMQDSCPNFAQHTFAISSVSGGSLGAGVFATLANWFAGNSDWQACDPSGVTGYFADATKEFFRSDLLAPLVGATLFPDLLQRLLPFPVKALDRSQSLEKGIEVAWSRLPAPNGKQFKEDWESAFHNSIQNLWNPLGATPALFLHTTSVASGSRYTLGPLSFGSTPTTDFYGVGLCPYSYATFELPLVSAVSLSARFPWLTPPGWLKIPTEMSTACDEHMSDYARQLSQGHNRLYLADGGYLENSGLEAAVEIVAKLRHLVGTRPEAFPGGVDIKIITVLTVDDFFDTFTAGGARSKTGFGEILAPINAMLNARKARTRAVQLKGSHYDDSFYLVEDQTDPNATRTHYKIPGASIDLTADNLHQVTLDGRGFFLPLGWRLSRRAIDQIGEQNSPNTSLTQKLIMQELAGEDTGTLKSRTK